MMKKKSIELRSGNEDNPHSISILFTGDIGLTSACKDSPELFAGDLIEHFSSSDAVCINLEIPFVNEQCKMAPYTHPSLRAPVSNAFLLKQINPAVVNIGTNHCMDGGENGIQLTKTKVAEFGACSIGAGVNEEEARKPCFLEIKGSTFGFLSYCKKGNFTASKRKAGAALLCDENLRTDIPEVSKSCDYLIVSMHMGMEFSESVHPMYRELAHLAVDLGASCVIGHHPHVIQGIETYNGAPIFYSLGNFLFDNYAGAVTHKGQWEDRHRGILAKVLFTTSDISYEVVTTLHTSEPLSVRLAQEGEIETIMLEVSRRSKLVIDGVDESSAEQEAFRAIAKREFATVIALTKLHGFRYLWCRITDMKVRHFRMILRSLWKGITRR